MNRKEMRALAEHTINKDVGCGDSACVFAHHVAATNNGCRCMKENPGLVATRLYLMLRSERAVYHEKEDTT